MVAAVIIPPLTISADVSAIMTPKVIVVFLPFIIDFDRKLLYKKIDKIQLNQFFYKNSNGVDRLETDRKAT
jgi:hypothetical protein